MLDRKRFVLSTAAALAVAPGVARAQPAGRDPYKIGVTFPLTGPLAASATDYINGAQVAADEINKTGGVNGHPLQLLVEDTQGSPQGGLAAMRKVVQVDGAQAVLSIYTNVITAQMPLAEELKVPFLCSIETPGLVSKSPYAFAHAASIANKSRLFEKFWRDHHAKRIYGFEVNNAYGVFMSGLAKAAAQNAGADYQESVFQDGETDYRGLVARAKDYGPDQLFVSQLGGVAGALIIREIREAGMTQPIILPGIFYDEPGWRNEVGGYIDNVVMSGITYDRRTAGAFIAAFHAKTGHDPSYQSGEQYDMIKMFAHAIAVSSYNGEAIRNALATLKGVPSIFGGTITMDPDHYSVPPGDTLWRVVRGQLVQLT